MTPLDQIAGRLTLVYPVAPSPSTSDKAISTMRRALCVLSSGLMLAGLMPSAASAGPAMSSSLQQTTLDQAGCVARGEAAVREAGMTQNVEAHQATVYGEQGEYTAMIRCAAGSGLVFFVVAGPRPERASKFMSDLRGRF